METPYQLSEKSPRDSESAFSCHLEGSSGETFAEVSANMGTAGWRRCRPTPTAESDGDVDRKGAGAASSSSKRGMKSLGRFDPLRRLSMYPPPPDKLLLLPTCMSIAVTSGDASKMVQSQRAPAETATAVWDPKPVEIIFFGLLLFFLPLR